MIKITNDVAINADRRSFSICFRYIYKGKSSWRAEYYFTDMDQLFKKLVNLAIVDGINEGSWASVGRRVEETKAMIEEKMALIVSRNTVREAAGIA
jgi:hypothetical protein